MSIMQPHQWHSELEDRESAEGAPGRTCEWMIAGDLEPVIQWNIGLVQATLNTGTRKTILLLLLEQTRLL